MTNPIRTCVAGALVAAVALPAAAVAQPGGHASARTKQRVHRVDIALEKAIDAIDDGDDAKAIAKLGAVDHHLARALKAANRQADGDKGPASLGLVAATADEVALTAADSLDEADQSLSDALVTTLEGALDDRDAIVGAVGGLDDFSDYDRVLSRMVSDSEDEAESFAEGVEDDTLVGSAASALGAAADQATATAQAAGALADTVADEEEDGDDEEEPADGEGDCPHGGGPRGPGGPQEDPSFRP